MSDAAERLYGLPLDDFVRERDALARELRQEGKRDEADEVKKLPKPSVVAHAVNRLARERPDELRRLLDAADALREAQVSGRGDFAEAAAAERGAVRDLVASARTVVEDATQATLDRVASTLHAAAADEEARGLLERGLLTREVEASGFGSLLGALPPPSKRSKPKGRARPDPKRRERERAEQAVERARTRAEAAERAAGEARESADRAAEELAEAERRLGEL